EAPAGPGRPDVRLLAAPPAARGDLSRALARRRRAGLHRGTPLGPAGPLRFRSEVLRMTFVHRTWRLAFALGLILAAGAVVPVLAEDGDVSIVGNSFAPTSVTIAAGDTVTWTITEASGEQHSVTSGSPGTDQGAVFDSGINLKDQGQSFQFTFDTAGTYSFFCQVHPTLMTGE